MTKKKQKKRKFSKIANYKTATFLFAFLLIISILTNGFTSNPTGISFSNDVEITESQYAILSDQRCDQCDQYVSQAAGAMNQLFTGMSYNVIDYSSDQGQELYEQLELASLPAIILDPSVKEKEGYSQIKDSLTEKEGYMTALLGPFDPKAEICDNDKDDNDNGLVDCEDPDCANAWKCMPKKNTPEVELFVMSYCPYGTQMQKAMIPVMETLGDKADIDVKFVDYVMHGAEEINENLVQYCIQKGQPALYLDYLKCFLQDSESEQCLTQTGVNSAALNQCIQETDVEYSVNELYEDKSTWTGGQFPQFNVHKELNEKYGVKGSPTLVINGVTASVSRSPAALLDAICTGFDEQPEECSVELSADTPSPGFGFEGTGADSQATC